MTERVFHRRTGVLLLIAVALALVAMTMVAMPSRAAAAFNVGDVFAAIGNGKIAHYSNTGTLLDTLDSTHSGTEDDGMCFDAAGNLYSTQAFSSNTMSKFSNNGTLLTASFGSGYNSDPESCSFNASNQMYVGQADDSADVLKFDTAGNPLASYSPATESRGTDWVDLAADQCTLYYTSEGSLVKRYNVCTNTQLTDLASGLTGACYALRIRPNGEVIVACTGQVYRLSPSGAVMQTYLASGFTPSNAFVFAVNLDPDGTTFWTGGYRTGDIYRVNIQTGAQVTHFVAANASPMGGLAVFGEQRAATQVSPSPSASVAAAVPNLPRSGDPGGSTNGVTTALVVGIASIGGLLAAGVLLERRPRRPARGRRT
jgi:sugar lactone lactonase YvrE